MISDRAMTGILRDAVCLCAFPVLLSLPFLRTPFPDGFSFPAGPSAWPRDCRIFSARSCRLAIRLWRLIKLHTAKGRRLSEASVKRVALKNQNDIVSEPSTEKTNAKPQHAAAITKAKEPSMVWSCETLRMVSLPGAGRTAAAG